MSRLPSLLILSLLASAPGATSRAESLRLRDGAQLEARVLEFREGVFHLEGGRQLPRDQVRELSPGASSAPSTAPDTPPPAAALAAPREPRAAAWVREAEELEARWPGFPAVILRDEALHTLRPDGTRTRRRRMLIRVLKDAGIGYGSWQASFDPTRERVELLSTRTVKPDGRVIPRDAAKTRLQDARSSAEHLTNRKLLVWRLDGVSRGDFVEHEYLVEEFSPFRPDFFFPRFGFQSRLPVWRSRLEVRAPASTQLRWVARNTTPEALNPEELEEQGERVLRFHQGPVEPFVPEPRAPGGGDLLPGVAVSNHENWDAFFAWEREELVRNIEPTPEIEAKALEVTRESPTPEDKVAAIYRFLQQEIRYVSVKSGIGSGWAGHPARETLANGYGDCVDKSVLFCSMLKTFGIQAYPLTLMTNSAHDMETRLPGFDANHCITRVDLPDRTLILDSTTTNYRYPWFRDDDHGQPATNPILGEISRVPIPPGTENLERRTLVLRLDAAGALELDDLWEGVGPAESRERGMWKGVKPGEYERVLRDYYAAVAPGGEVTDHEVGDPDDLETPMGYRARYRTREYGVRAGPLMIVKLPFFGLSFSEASLDSRRFPIDYRTKRRTELRWEVRLPPGFRVKAAPADLVLEDPAARLELRTGQEGEHFVVERSFEILDPLVPAARYPEYRAFLKRLEALGKEQLFLEEVAP